MLNNVVVPIQYPDVSIGPDFRHDRRGPFVITGQQVDRRVGLHPCAITLDHERTNQLASGTTYKSSAIPPGLRIVASCVQSMACRCRVAAVVIDLSHLVCDGVEQVVGADHRKGLGSPSLYAFVITVRDGHEETGLPVSSRAKDQAFFGNAQPPGVVRRGSYEL